MDVALNDLVDFTLEFNYAHLTEQSVCHCRRRIIDTVGCGLAAFDAEPSRIARSIAGRMNLAGGATILGAREKALPELAAFANSVMSRYLEGNDCFPGGGGHPSDMILPILAVAQCRKANGKAVMTAIAVGYQVFHYLFKSLLVRDNGLDHVLYTGVGTAAAAAKLLDLTKDETRNALSLALVPNVALDVTRRGNLSMWKGCAAGNAARNGVFAAYLAKSGMTGPDSPIEGSHGLADLLGGRALPKIGKSKLHIESAHYKFFLTEYHSQAPIMAVLALLPDIDIGQIEKITIFTYWFTWSEIGNDVEKWHPTTRETADHSLPFIIAAVLTRGSFSDAIFSDAYIRNREIHSLADRISVVEDPAYTARFPDSFPCRIEIEMQDGRMLMQSMDNPKGHVHAPMTDQELDNKFRMLAGRVIDEPQIDKILGFVASFDAVASVDPLFEAAVISR